MAYKFDSSARYADSHEWARVEGDVVVCGISDYAQHSLSDVVYVSFPEVGENFKKGDLCVTVESVKAVGEVYAPVSGEVVAVNEDLDSDPELVNEDPYGAAWLVKIKPADLGELEQLMNAAAYEASVAEHE